MSLRSPPGGDGSAAEREAGIHAGFAPGRGGHGKVAGLVGPRVRGPGFAPPYLMQRAPGPVRSGPVAATRPPPTPRWGEPECSCAANI